MRDFMVTSSPASPPTVCVRTDRATSQSRGEEVAQATYRAGIWTEAAAFCAAARDGIDFTSLTESTVRQEGAFDMADHLAATFKEMAESARRFVARHSVSDVQSKTEDAQAAECEACQRGGDSQTPSPSLPETTATEGKPGMIMVPKAAIDWLLGEGPDDNGLWFGDFSTEQPKGHFWWRTVFRRLISASPLPTGTDYAGLSDAHLTALLRYTEGFYGAAMRHGMKAAETANAVAHVESAARALHSFVLSLQQERDALASGIRAMQRTKCGPECYADRLRNEHDLLSRTHRDTASHLAQYVEENKRLKGKVERMRGALEGARVTLEIYADPTGYTDAHEDPYTHEDQQHPGIAARDAVKAIDATLSTQSEEQGR